MHLILELTQNIGGILSLETTTALQRWCQCSTQIQLLSSSWMDCTPFVSPYFGTISFLNFTLKVGEAGLGGWLLWSIYEACEFEMHHPLYGNIRKGVIFIFKQDKTHSRETCSPPFPLLFTKPCQVPVPNQTHCCFDGSPHRRQESAPSSMTSQATAILLSLPKGWSRPEQRRF